MTPFEDIYEYALADINDYRLDRLAQVNYDSFLIQMKNLLINAIPQFTNCLKPLDYIDATTPYFETDLNVKEKSILGAYMARVWFNKNTNDLTQINEGLQGRDKKNHSKSSNLKEKKSRLVQIDEVISQRVCDYQLSDMDVSF